MTRYFRYFSLARVFTSATISAQLEYRANFIGAILSSLGEVSITLLGLAVLFGQAEITNLGGWNFYESLVVVGFFSLTEGVISMFIQPNTSKIAEAVRTGSMDFTLLKPIDAQFNISTRNLNVLMLPALLMGLGIIIYAALHLHVTFGGVVLAAVLYGSAIVIVYCIYLALSTTAFWFVKTQNATELFAGVFAAARFPLAAFPVPMRFFLTFIVPIAFITTVPSEALIGRLSPALALASPVVAALSFVATRMFWKKAVASYTSASS